MNPIPFSTSVCNSVDFPFQASGYIQRALWVKYSCTPFISGSTKIGKGVCDKSHVYAYDIGVFTYLYMCGCSDYLEYVCISKGLRRPIFLIEGKTL